jgi:hypothetical protein
MAYEAMPLEIEHEPREDDVDVDLSHASVDLWLFTLVRDPYGLAMIRTCRTSNLDEHKGKLLPSAENSTSRTSQRETDPRQDTGNLVSSELDFVLRVVKRSSLL